MITEQSQFLSKWVIRTLKETCYHAVVTEMLDNKYTTYVRCAACGRTIKLMKERRTT